MFGILTNCATKKEDPRINTSSLGGQLQRKWKHIEPLLEFIELYCYEKSIQSLSALVVRSTSDPGISFPGEWFGKHVPDDIKKEILDHKLPLTEPQKQWYRKYWQDISTNWKVVDIAKEAMIFSEWLTHQTDKKIISSWSEIEHVVTRSIDEWKNKFTSTPSMDKNRSIPQSPKSQSEKEPPTGYFKWPSTWAPKGWGAVKFPTDMSGYGLFRLFCYHVGKGKKSKPDDERKEIMDRIFQSNLDGLEIDIPIEEYAEPKTPERLKKMADVLASQARNYSRNEYSDYSTAISHYKTDLDYLYRTYYVGYFGFNEATEPPFNWPDFPDNEVDDAPLPLPTSHETEPVANAEPRKIQPTDIDEPTVDEEVTKPNHKIIIATMIIIVLVLVLVYASNITP